MSAAPVYWLCLSSAGGVCLAEALLPSTVVSLVAGALVAPSLAVAARLRPVAARGIGAGLAMGLLALSLAGLRFQSIERSALSGGASEKAAAVLHGQILDRPRATHDAMRFTLGVAQAWIDGRRVELRERAAVTVRPVPSQTPDAGALVEVGVRLTPLGDDEYARHLRHRGVAARASARGDALTIRGRTSNPVAALARAGQRAVGSAAAALPAPERGLLLGVPSGDATPRPERVVADFRTAGLSHLLAVSGGNLAMVLGAIMLMLGGTRARTRVIVLSVVTFAFMAVTRFEPSILRAGAMTGVALIGLAAGARRYSAYTLGVACCALMIWDPMLVFSGGFQLSALATLGLIVIAPRLRRALGAGKVAAAASITMGAQLAVTPLLVLRFHEVSLVALPANMLALPAVAPATVLGFIAAVLGRVWQPLGDGCALLAFPFLRFMRAVAERAALVPNASLPTPSGIGAWLSVAAALTLVVAALRIRSVRVTAVAAALMAVVAATTWAGALTPGLPAGLQIIALDVGQGDAILVREPRGATMLVDGGPDPRLLAERLKAHRVKHLDVMVLTHPHADHANGLLEAAGRYRAGRIIDSGEPPSRDTSASAAALLRQKIPRVVVRAGASFAFGAAHVDVLSPAELFRGTNSDPNNGSVVLRIRYGLTCALLSGDVEEDAQDRLLREAKPALRCPVFKVPHHGSKRALREFYAATEARYAIVSVGDNDYGHPAAAPMTWMRELGMRVYRTDRHGDVTVVLGSGGGIAVRTG